MARAIQTDPGGPVSRGAVPLYGAGEGHWVPTPSPPPPPSARHTAPYPTKPIPTGTVSPEPATWSMEEPLLSAAQAPTPLDAEVTEPGPDLADEKNPFKQPGRWRKWLRRPKRETMLRATVAVVAGVVGWGVGAKPWTSPQKGRPAVATASNAPVSKKPAGAVRSGATPKSVPAGDRRVAAETRAAAPPVKSPTGVQATTVRKTPLASTTKAGSKTAAPSSQKTITKAQTKSRLQPARNSGKTSAPN
jgi:hypothetical protein